MKLSKIAKLVDGEIVGDSNVEIERVAKIEDAGRGDITFIANVKYKKYLKSTKATAILVAINTRWEELLHRPDPIQLVLVKEPYSAFLCLAELFYPPPSALPVGVHPTAVVSKSATIGNEVAIGAHVVIGERCKIGERVTLNAGSVLCDDVEIEDLSFIYPNVTIREGCKVGKRVILHSGTVIGSDGFGFTPQSDGTYEKIPQRGIVVVEDDVEIGANCTIDRATIGETRIKQGVKLDNLIHVAHNVVIGEHTVIAAQTGISGSTKIGKNCIIAGQVGFIGHIEIADRTTFAAQSGVPKTITEPGKTYFGSPVKEHHHAFRIEGAIRQLPELLVEIRNLKQRIEKIERQQKVESQD